MNLGSALADESGDSGADVRNLWLQFRIRVLPKLYKLVVVLYGSVPVATFLINLTESQEARREMRVIPYLSP